MYPIPSVLSPSLLSNFTLKSSIINTITVHILSLFFIKLTQHPPSSLLHLRRCPDPCSPSVFVNRE
ncbi:hypothetical protein KSS87_008794 [Heliosperma pusillum]|nr:hypothetical protein KSS87_008794 [Heliosperma pusillum]